MTRSPTRQLFSVLILSASVGAAGQTPTQTAPSEHSSMVTFHVSAHHAPAPMRVVRVMLDGKETALDTPVPVEGMWMRSISVTLLNVSAKTIVVCGVSVDFPETRRAKKGPVPSIMMRKGKFPQHALVKRDGTIQKPNDSETEFLVPPGSLVTFHAPEGADWDQEQAYKLVDPITKVNVDMSSIYFSDESKWAAGSYYVPLPPPDLWKEITPEEFVAWHKYNQPN